MLWLGLALIAAGAAQAQVPYQPWQFRPMEPSNARGVPPQPPAQPAGAPSGQQPAQGAAPVWPQPGGAPGAQQAMPPGYPPGARAPAYPQGAQAPAYPQGAQAPGYPQGLQAPTYPQGAQAPGYPPGGQAPAGQFPFQQPGGRPGYGQPPYVQPGAPGQAARPAPTQPGGYQPYQPGQRAPGGYYAPRGGLTPGRPRLEVIVDENDPYVQQNVLVRLRVVSAGNLATASPDLAGIDDALFEQLEGPVTSTRGSGNSQEIVNEYVLSMTPLRDGPLEIGPMKVSGTLAGGVPFEAVARGPIALDVRPPMASVRPWLPLRGLRIDAELTEADGMARGRPATLTVELEAEGAVGDQLPSVEHMLRSEDFRVYREQTMTDTRLTENGRALVGKRIEVYTLVPHSGGRLQLPELRLNWWNVETASREASSEPIRVFNVAGESGPFGFAGSTRADGGGSDWQKYWLPVAGLALLLLGYWGGVWLRGRVPAGERGALWPRLRGLLGSGARLTGRGLAAAGRVLNPAPLVRRLRDALAMLAPRGTRVYQCARAADSADDPAAWCLIFQQQACRRLAADAREPLPRMADRITALRPGADREQLHDLMQRLDRALYNRGEIDFPRWKREFRRALRPGTGALGSVVGARIRRARLPALNPRPAG